MKVPFLDLKSHHDPIREEVRAVLEEVIEQNAFAGGPYVEAFEKEFASYCGSAEAVGVGSGTEALWLALLAMGIGEGDEVITVPNTFIATAEAISFTGAKPVFVDVLEETYNMDPRLLEEAVTSRTRAIIPVHLYGQMADMNSILEIADARKIPVVEDAAQAHGATCHGRLAGSMGVAGCFSFYPGKNLGAWGEAGAVVTDDANLAEVVRKLRDHGQPRKYMHDVVGWNSRMDGMQGAVLSVKLARLNNGNRARGAVADRYAESLAEHPDIGVPVNADDAGHVYHLYVVRVRDRDRVQRSLTSRGVGCGIHYPVPVHLQPAYRHLGYGEGSFPVSERSAREILSLPMFPELREEQVDYVTAQLIAVVSEKENEKMTAG
jgi:dTDP-4-amino-4,6-dideoxygalactose transaminase